MDFIYVALGLVILVFAGDALVRGAISLSQKLGVPPFIVSLTIVAIGTSAPEMLVAINAVLEGAPGIAVGNIVGSNIANVLLVLGLPALLFGISTADHQPIQNFLQMIFATAIFAIFAFTAPITWPGGLVLLGIYLSFIGYSIHSARRTQTVPGALLQDGIEVEGGDSNSPWWQTGGLVALGLVGLPLGAKLLVGGATHIALSYGVSETVIGLTLVAVGTSLPELATTITAAMRRHTEVVLGSVIGSNITNLLAIVGIAALFGDIPVVPAILRFDLWVLIASSLMLTPFVFFRINITRGWGALFTVIYVAYIVFVFTQRSQF